MDIVEALRNIACPADEPWTGARPDEDHGHTDCWVIHLAAKEIERLRSLVDEMRPHLLDYVASGLMIGGHPLEHDDSCDDCNWYRESIELEKRIKNGEFS